MHYPRPLDHFISLHLPYSVCPATATFITYLLIQPPNNNNMQRIAYPTAVPDCFMGFDSDIEDDWSTDDELDAEEFSLSIQSRHNAKLPVDIPGSPTSSVLTSSDSWDCEPRRNGNTSNDVRRKRTRAPLPISKLNDLDEHVWNHEKNILAKWVQGAGIGQYCNSVTDNLFTPCSPPTTLRRSRLQGSQLPTPTPVNINTMPVSSPTVRKPITPPKQLLPHQLAQTKTTI